MGAIPAGSSLWPEAGTANSPSSDPQQSGGDHQATVLVVDDDPTLQNMIFDYFVDNNIQTLLASDRKEMHRQLSAQDVNVVILDLRLGLDDGLDVLRELRLSSDVPVIVITGHRPDEIDRVIGLELGADDYVTKPFNLRELLARVRAIIRRLDKSRSSPAREPERGGYRFAGWRLNLRTRKLTDPNDANVALTKGEYALLVAFLNAPQRPLSREQLLQATRVHEDVFDRSIDVQILRVRRKLEHDPSAPQIIQTERGVGYVFAQQVERY
jgi:DNA-binding response OmpR family regulator